MRQNPDMRSRISVLGESLQSREEELQRVEKMVCTLYGDNNSDSIDKTRFKLFCKNQHLQSHQLPPTNAALIKHLKRANYQVYVWKHALMPTITDQTPDGEGWKLIDNHLKIDWTDKTPAPVGVMVSVCCACKGTSESRRCSCVKNSLPCTDACFCNEECKNQFKEDFDEGEEDEIDEDDPSLDDLEEEDSRN